MTIQLDMFRQDDMNAITAKVDKIEKSTQQVRRGLFARMTARDKDFVEMRDRIDEQDRRIHKLEVAVYGDEKSYLEVVK